MGSSSNLNAVLYLQPPGTPSLSPRSLIVVQGRSRCCSVAVIGWMLSAEIMVLSRPRILKQGIFISQPREQNNISSSFYSPVGIYALCIKPDDGWCKAEYWIWALTLTERYSYRVREKVLVSKCWMLVKRTPQKSYSWKCREKHLLLGDWVEI